MRPVIVLGVTGSVAAYRAADLARELMRRGYEVRACLSRAAQEFVTAQLFESLTGNPCLTHAFDEPVRGRMAHIDWARVASAVVVCPATANAIAVLARGEADDMLTTIVCASNASMVVAPAMNPQMFASPANVENIDILRSRGVSVVEPAEGDVACGEFGQGKLASIEKIVAAVESAVFRSKLYEGKRILITAGPTHEPIDAVRYLGNRSSGKMGFAMAQAALQMGAKVTLVAGPVSLSAPPMAETVRVTTAQDMLDAVLDNLPDCDLLIGAAAVADFRALNPSETKISGDRPIELPLGLNPDILARARGARPDLPIVGFSADVADHKEKAVTKINEKGLVAIAANDVSRNDIAFESDYNEITLFTRDGEFHIERDRKFNVAVKLLEKIRELIS